MTLQGWPSRSGRRSPRGRPRSIGFPCHRLRPLQPAARPRSGRLPRPAAEPRTPRHRSGMPDPAAAGAAASASVGIGAVSRVPRHPPGLGATPRPSGAHHDGVALSSSRQKVARPMTLPPNRACEADGHVATLLHPWSSDGDSLAGRRGPRLPCERRAQCPRSSLVKKDRQVSSPRD